MWKFCSQKFRTQKFHHLRYLTLQAQISHVYVLYIHTCLLVPTICVSISGKFTFFGPLKNSLACQFLQVLVFAFGSLASGCGRRHNFVYVMAIDSKFMSEHQPIVRAYHVLWYYLAHSHSLYPSVRTKAMILHKCYTTRNNFRVSISMVYRKSLQKLLKIRIILL